MKTGKYPSKTFFFKVFFSLYSFFFIGSCSKFPLTEFTDGIATHAPEHKDSTIIIWKDPNASQAAFDQWKIDHGLTSGRAVKKICEFCSDGDDLELYDGVSMQTLVQGSGGGGGGTTCTGTHCGPSGGGDGTAYYCYNFSMDLPEPTGPVDSVDDNYQIHPQFKNQYPVPSTINLPSQNGFPGGIVTVAIFDTGVDPVITGQYTSGINSICNPGASRGWNYSVSPNNSNASDDYPLRHGSTVAKFIVDQVIQYQNQKVNIIPVKIHDAIGRSSLYNVLCGIIYASKSNVNIINASFGFYWDDPNTSPLLLGEFIKYYLTSKGILLVAAAGNEEKDDDNFAMSIGVPSTLLRNLDYHPFYPACFAGKSGFDNVISVTTFSSISGNEVSPFQNYSSHYVDAAVNCDIIYNRLPPPATQLEFGFIDPLHRLRRGMPLIISGTSYATPIITGKIVAYFDQLTAGMIGSGTSNQIDKTELFRRMEARNLIDEEQINLPLQVKSGKYAERAGTP